MRYNQLAKLWILWMGLWCGCSSPPEMSSTDPVNWRKRMAVLPPVDDLVQARSYLSVYSEIYSQSEEKTHDLTATVSLRNVSLTDSVFVLHANYYNTEGHLIRTYFEDPIYIRPLETVEIIIDKEDRAGGSGANFVFHWATRPGADEPFFEAVMISTSGHQGLSFTTRGIRQAWVPAASSEAK